MVRKHLVSPASLRAFVNLSRENHNGDGIPMGMEAVGSTPMAMYGFQQGPTPVPLVMRMVGHIGTYNDQEGDTKTYIQAERGDNSEGKMKITLNLTTFYSTGDERRFFQGLTGNSAVSKISGFGRQLEVTLVLNRLSRDALRDLIALLWRYGISLEALSFLVKKDKFMWINDERYYWYKSMFPER